MRYYIILISLSFIFSNHLSAQDAFYYDVALTPVTIDSMPGIHSFAFAQWENKILLIGGRRDGLHARQPFNAFPESYNNTDIIVLDIDSNTIWSKAISELPLDIQEQFQSTNINFAQVKDTLYLIGGYAYAASQDDHITFPKLSTIIVSKTIQDIIQGNDINNHIKQIEDEKFAVTGGQLGYLENKFYLVGGHNFNGRYNPMGHPSYVQTYTNQIRKFQINNSLDELQISSYEEITDPVHLRRRDFNLIEQVFPDGTLGLTISSGVFQIDEDLPYLYPVDIRTDGYQANTQFSQLLSNYHSAHLSLFDEQENQMHSLFFGGMSQRYYEANDLIEDTFVPFVKTISRMTRYGNGEMAEFKLNAEMPLYQGSSAEFIINEDLPLVGNEIIDLNQLDQDTILLGHIVGGIFSVSKNPFSFNLSSSNTMADHSIYAVHLHPAESSSVSELDNKNPYDFILFPNPAKSVTNVQFSSTASDNVQYMLTNPQGQILEKGSILNQKAGENDLEINLEPYHSKLMYVTLIFEHKYYVTKVIKID